MNNKKTSIDEINFDHHFEQQIASDDIDDDNLYDTILDFSIDTDIRIRCLERYYIINKSDAIEVVSRMASMYCFSGTKSIEKFLYDIVINAQVSVFLKLEATKALLSFEEEEEDIDLKENDTMKSVKTESNLKIKQRNLSRYELSFECLNHTCSLFKRSVSAVPLSLDDELPSPCKIEAVCKLMECSTYKEESLTYFKDVINDDFIDIDYRYKSILSIEERTDSKGPEKYKIQDRIYYLKNACLEFLNNKNNFTMYRILAGQYLLQRITLDPIVSRKVQMTLLSFARDNDLDVNLRADAADTLLNLADDLIRQEARAIIMTLGRLLGGHQTVYNNAQNVHTNEVESSVKDILFFLTSFPTLQVNKLEVNIEYVTKQISDIITKDKETKIALIHSQRPEEEYGTFEPSGSTGATGCTGPAFISCYFCIFSQKEEDIIDLDEKMIDSKFFCSEQCFAENEKVERMMVALNRINIDRVLYSKFNQTLANILIKTYSYIVDNTDNREEMTKRLLEELHEMAHTCSSGFATRICNSISGFGELSIRISFEDQIIGNYIARMNCRARDIAKPGSAYYDSKHKDVVSIYLKNHKLFPKAGTYSKEDVLIDYLRDNRKQKIQIAVEEFADNVLCELIDVDGSFDDRRNFIFFFKDNMLSVREELYEEFCPFVSDSDFDLITRKCVMAWEGLEYLI